MDVDKLIETIKLYGGWENVSEWISVKERRPDPPGGETKKPPP